MTLKEIENSDCNHATTRRKILVQKRETSMFSIFKKTSTEQNIVLQDLTEEQLAQAAGGRDNDHDWDDRKKLVHRHHHHHHMMNDHDWDDRKKTSTSFVTNTTPFTGHWQNEAAANSALLLVAKSDRKCRFPPLYCDQK